MSNSHTITLEPSFLRRASFFACALFLLAASGLHAATHSVCASGCDFTSIQAANDAAANGDTLALSPETFFEGDVLLDRDLTVTTSAGRATIDGGGASTVVEIDADAVVSLKNLRLTNASRAIVTNHGIAYLKTVEVLGNGGTSIYGGIVNYASGFLVIQKNSVVAGNKSESLGGGINNFGILQVMNTTVIGNRGRLGGGIFNSKGDVVVGASSISFNHATIRGGGYANANVGGGVVIVLPSSSYSGNTADSACDRYYDIHRTPACVD